MKNNFTKYIILFFLLINFQTLVFSNEVKFEAENIETTDKDIITATKNVVINDNNGNKIYSDKLIIDNTNKTYTISENVIIKNNQKSITLSSQKIIYNVNKKNFVSIGETIIDKNENYSIETSDIEYNAISNKIFSKKKSIIRDKKLNEIEVENFIISLNENSFIANNAKIIDKELNTYNIKKIYYDFNQNKILGQDASINQNNKISSQEYLPRAEGKIIIFEDGDITLKKAVFTNCKKRKGCPQWSINAEEVNHDKKNKIINYKNATFNFYDIPVLYFPKFFHPDPTVDRQSGFLAPSLLTQNSTNYLKTPYFFAISESSDFTFSPRFYDNQKNLYQGEYRHVTENSNHIIDTSIKSDNVLPKNSSSQSHFFSKSSIETNFDLFDYSKLDLQIQSVSNDDYLKFNNISSPIITSKNTLNSKVEFEGSNDDLEFSLNAEIYEDLSKDNDSDKYEFILPNFNLSKNFETKFDGIMEISSSGYNKFFETNINEKVIINDLNYKSLDSINKVGMINNYQFLIRNFNADSKNSKSLNNKSENNIRGIFQFNSKFPLQKKGQKYISNLTPIFTAKFNPQENKNISNKNRLIDYANIYSIDRISSTEVLEGGGSITIGNEFKIFDKLDKNNELFGINLATSFRPDENTDLPDSSSLGQKTSNIVGQSKFKLNEFVELQYDFISDNNLGDFHYHNMNSKFRVNNFVTTFEFIEENDEIGTTHFIANETSFVIDETKNLKFKTRKNKKTDLTEYYNLIYQYKMDCLVAAIEYNKDYYSDGTLKPEESLFFSVTIMPFDNSLNLPGIDK